MIVMVDVVVVAMVVVVVRMLVVAVAPCARFVGPKVLCGQLR